MTVFDHMAIGRSAMRAFRLAMNIAGYNVANANTPGFTRRRIELGTLDAAPVPGGMLGLGVDVISVERLRDRFLDFSTRREMSRLGADQSAEQILTGLEPMLGEAESGAVATSLSNFFDALESLGVQPDSVTVRGDVVTRAMELAATFRRVDGYFVDARRNTDDRIGAAVDRVNTILTELRQINVDVVEQEASGAEASDVRDQRDRLLDELSGLIAVRTVEQSNGQVSVFLEGVGDALLSGVTVRGLEVGRDAEGMRRIIVDRSGEKKDLTNQLRAGELGGFLKVRDDDLARYRTTLDALAAAVITEVNAVHRIGYGLTGRTDVPLFEPDPPGAHAAAAIQVNAEVEQDPRLIAAADGPDEAGNNANALLLAALRGRTFASLGGRTFLEHAGGLMGDVGRDVKAAAVGVEAGRAIVDALELKRDQVSGVSLDDEAADLMRWQQSFQASARFLKTVNDVLDTAIEMLMR